MNTKSHIDNFFRFLFLGVVLFFSPPLFTSCFTGVEGTKKITLSKEDRKTLEPSDEELFFKGINGVPLPRWEMGKQFIAADDKAVLIFDQQGLPADPASAALGGKTLEFQGTNSRVGADGKKYVAITFKEGDRTFTYNTGKVTEEAQSLLSDQIPMIIDSSMVESAKSLLIGKNFWIKSPLWYDEAGNRIPGLKFVPVSIVDVLPASAAFPLKLKFMTNDGKAAWLFMNFGNSGTESRSFPALFSLSDIRQRYPSVSDDVWSLVCQGKVKGGMTKEECKLALGNPSEVNSGHDYSQTLDLWHYSDGATLWFEDGILTKFRQ